MLTPGDGIAVAAICATILSVFIVWFIRKSNGKHVGCDIAQIKECAVLRKELGDKLAEFKLDVTNEINGVKLDVNTIQGRLDKLFELFQKIP